MPPTTEMPPRSAPPPPAAVRMRAAYAAHRDPVWRFLVRRLGDGDLAEDLTSEVFVVAWRRHRDAAASERDRAAALELPWLYGVARRVLANDLRAAGRRRALAGRLEAEARTARDAAVGSAGDELDRLLADATVLAALACLPEPDREVLLLAGWEGLEPREIAVALDCRLGTARVRLHRARGRLARLLDLPATAEGTTR